jgi:hypothetical protein
VEVTVAKKKSKTQKKKAGAPAKKDKPVFVNLLETISTQPLSEQVTITGTVNFDRQYSILTEAQGVRSVLDIFNPSGPNPNPQGFGPTTAYLEYQLGKTDNDPLMVLGFRTVYGSTRVICFTKAQ